MKTAITLGDIHVPYHSRPAVRLVTKVIRQLHPDYVIQIGDLFDAYALSTHERTRGVKPSIAKELRATEKVVAQISKAATFECEKIYLRGNHEERFDRYVANKAKELDGLELLAPEHYNGLHDYLWRVYPYRHAVQIGHIRFSHDWGAAGETAMERTYAKTHTNCVFGHTHRLGVKYFGTVFGERHVAMNVGWLGDWKALDYTHRDDALRNSQLGFGLIRFSDSGVAHCQAIPLVWDANALTCVVDGVLVSVKRPLRTAE